MPEDPVPITATRLPMKSTFSRGQRAVKYTSPWNASVPGISGVFGADTAAPMARRILAALLDVKETGLVQGGGAPD